MSEEIKVPIAPAPPPPDPTPSSTTGASASASTGGKDPIADAPPTTSSEDIASKALGEGTPAPEAKAPEPEAPEPKAEAPEEEPPSWTWDNWTGDIEAVPEDHRDAAKAVSDFYANQIAEQKAIVQALEEVIDQTGQDPRLARSLADIERLTEEMEKKQADLQAALEKATGLEGQLTEAQSAREALLQQQEEMAIKEFLYRNPELADKKSKAYKRVEEILADEEAWFQEQVKAGVPEDQVPALWELWELPDLEKLSKTEFKKVRQLRIDGVPTKYAMELAKADSRKDDDRFPADKLAGTDAPSSRPTLTKKPGGGTFQDTLDSVAENTLLKFRKRV